MRNLYYRNEFKCSLTDEEADKITAAIIQIPKPIQIVVKGEILKTSMVEVFESSTADTVQKATIETGSDRFAVKVKEWNDFVERSKKKTPEQKANENYSIFNCAWHAYHHEDIPTNIVEKIKPQLIQQYSENPNKFYPTNKFLFGVLKLKEKKAKTLNIIEERVLAAIIRTLNNANQ